jgi:hypothetical protein
LGSVEIASVSVYVVHWTFKLWHYKTKQSENTSGGCLSLGTIESEILLALEQFKFGTAY